MIDYTNILENEYTLDPDNWDDIERMGVEMVKDMISYLRNIRKEPSWRPISDSAKKDLHKPIPTTPQPLRTIYNDYVESILPYPTGNIHPKFWAWADGTGSVVAMLADMLASGLNPNVCAGEHSSMYVEQQVIDWLKEMMGFPATSSGILLSGGAMSNLTALIIARNSFDKSIRKKGINSKHGLMTIYTSEEAHSCIEKAADVMGLGLESVIKIPVEANYQINISILKEQIHKDKANGLLPFCIVGNVGTVNTGAIDPIDELLLIAKEESMWLHIDGAFGAFAKLVPEYSKQLNVLSEVDSITFDLHKWMYLPFGIGCLLVKNKELHKDSFAIPVEYLFKHERGLASGPDIISDYGIEMSRGFKSLSVWFCLQTYGINKLKLLIRQNVAQAFYLQNLIEKETQLELLAHVSINVVCFRFNPQIPNIEAKLNEINKEIVMKLQESGDATPSYTMLKGIYTIRVAIINHRSRKEDFDSFITSIIKIGNELIGF